MNLRRRRTTLRSLTSPRMRKSTLHQRSFVTRACRIRLASLSLSCLGSSSPSLPPASCSPLFIPDVKLGLQGLSTTTYGRIKGLLKKSRSFENRNNKKRALVWANGTMCHDMCPLIAYAQCKICFRNSLIYGVFCLCLCFFCLSVPLAFCCWGLVSQSSK